MKRLVVIDDEAIVVEGVKAIIQKLQLDYEVVGFAYDGLSAHDMILEKRPDVVITDIRIPGMDGLSLIESCKEELEDTFFVVISGYQEFTYARRALQLQVTSYIDKPITMEKLAEVLHEVDRQRQERQNAARAPYEVLTDSLIRAIGERDEAAVRQMAGGILAAMRESVPTLEDYKSEVYKIVCAATGVFNEEDHPTRRGRGLPSFSELQGLPGFDEVDAYAVAAMDEIADQIAVEKTGSGHQTITQLLRYIHQNYHKDIGLNELADMVGMNPSYLSILFKEEVGTSYIKYLTRLRIQNACKLLDEGRKVIEVSELVGYRNYRYFCDIFKKSEGVTPTEYKGVTRKKKQN